MVGFFPACRSPESDIAIMHLFNPLILLAGLGLMRSAYGTDNRLLYTKPECKTMDEFQKL